MYKCITGFKIKCFKKDNPEIEKLVIVAKEDILEDDGEYIIKNGFCVCNRNSIFAKNHFKKCD